MKLADVDPQFKRIGGNDRAHLCRAHASLDGASLVRQVAASIAAHVLRCLLAQIAEQQFSGQPRTAKYNRLQTGIEAVGGAVGHFQRGAAPDTLFRVEQRWVVEDDMLFPTRRAVLLDQRDGLLDQLLGQRLRIGDGGAGADKLGGTAIVGAEAAQPAQHVGDMAAEDPAIGVHLVDHHKTQPIQKARPLRVKGQNAHVQHIGVGQQQARRLANARAVGGGGVAVVGEG